MATLGDFAGLVVHKMRSNFSAIGVRARAIQRIKGDDARKKELAAEIESLAAKVLQQIQSLMKDIPEHLRAADLHEMISTALEQIDVPTNIVRRVDFPDLLLDAQLVSFEFLPLSLRFSPSRPKDPFVAL